jgi:tripartite-type tricarboxylate transporter receptor subunit TctC
MRIFLAIGLALLVGTLPAKAQDYPNREIRVYCGFPAGSGADILVRYFTEKLRPLAGQPIQVENKPGAFGNIAAEAVARARPDGYHLLITPGSGTHSNNPHMFKQLPFDPVKDFTPLTTLARQGFILIVDPKLPIRSVSDLTAHLKAKGAKATYGGVNPFSLAAGELYKSIAGAPAELVRYNAAAPAIQEMLDGSLDFLFADTVFALEQAKAGRVRALAVTMPQRIKSAPDLVTMQEAGVPGYGLTGWWAAYFPANTPQPIAQKMELWLNQIVAMPETGTFLVNAGNEPFPGNRDSLVKWQAEDLARWGEIHAKANIPKI